MNPDQFYILFVARKCVRCVGDWFMALYNKFKTIKEKFTSGVVILEHGLTGRPNTSASTIRLLIGMDEEFF